MGRRWRWIVGAVALLGLALDLVVGTVLVAPARRTIPAPPAYLRAESLRLKSESGADLAGWLVTPPEARAAVLLLHGVRSSRADMVARVELLWHSGFAVLALDLQAHGESTGDHITFGALEGKDAASGLAYLRQRFPGLKVGAVGVSLGGAAIVLGSHPDAAVLEAVYTSIEEATENRVAMRLGPLSRVVTPLMLLQLRPRLGVSASDLRPVEAIGHLACPVLIISGDVDRHTTPAQTHALFDAARQPKELWMVPGAAHVDLLRQGAVAYREHVIGFLNRYLAR